MIYDDKVTRKKIGAPKASKNPVATPSRSSPNAAAPKAHSSFWPNPAAGACLPDHRWAEVSAAGSWEGMESMETWQKSHCHV